MNIFKEKKKKSKEDLIVREERRKFGEKHAKPTSILSGKDFFGEKIKMITDQETETENKKFNEKEEVSKKNILDKFTNDDVSKAKGDRIDNLKPSLSKNEENNLSILKNKKNASFKENKKKEVKFDKNAKEMSKEEEIVESPPKKKKTSLFKQRMLKKI